ncbi:type I restriction-modification system subunit M [Mycoplasma hafezii]|uniref:type I restriction-modification system subunit M n=1 Tax=Mycoplasma hafezii TaxID=525886 RepID=UPI003CF10C40
MNNKKENEREELHKTIWAIADSVRGKINASEFMSYVLSTMFYRYISENITNFVNQNEEKSGNKGFDYAKMPDEEAEKVKDYLIETKGFFIKPSFLFENVVKRARHDENLNETLEEVFRSIEDSTRGYLSEGDFKGLFSDFQVNNLKIGDTVLKRNKIFTNLLEKVAEMELGDYKHNTIDVFGDAYEYLMGMYASNAGKSGGEFFTPQEVSELLIKLTTYGKTEVDKVYDMCAGSGSLILKAIKVLGKENVRKGFFGQEVNPTTFNLCRMNMFLHDINYDKFKIACDDTLIHPQLQEEAPFDVIVSNPPYSIKWEGDKNPMLIDDPRFTPAGVLAPNQKADLAFVMHALSYLSNDGAAAIVCFPGIFYRAGAELEIRKYLVDNNYVDALIQLPNDLFYGTGISTTIIVMKKNRTNTDIVFINAEKEFVKITKNNKLTEDNINAIMNAYTKREEIENFSRVISYDEIVDNNYSLAVNNYIAGEVDAEAQIDINELNKEIDAVVKRQEELRAKINEIIKKIEGTNK